MTVGDVSYRICSESHLGSVRVEGRVNDKPFTAQLERGAGSNPLALRVSHNGAQIEAMVLSPLGARLHRLMPYKAPPDLSRFLMSPMPGLLVEVAVQPGQQVRAGEKLAVIEAMKMENVLFAARDGVVGTISAARGESLAVDQVILEFASAAAADGEAPAAARAAPGGRQNALEEAQVAAPVEVTP